MSIKENIIKVTEIKNQAAERAGRSGDDVLLCAVTKTHGGDMINEASMQELLISVKTKSRKSWTSSIP